MFKKRLENGNGGIGMQSIHETRLINDAVPFDHEQLTISLFKLSERYPFLKVGSIGCSIFGRTIPLLTLGSGKRELLYVGAHHGMEWITSLVLVRFVNDFCEQVRQKCSVYHISLLQLLETHTVYVIPMLNPDGIQYQIHGVEKDNPFYERLLVMNGESTDFSHWQANARGVDLNHNYDAGFSEYKRLEAEHGIPQGAPTRYSGTAPESEPEVAQLCNFIRFRNLRAILTFHTQGEEIFYRSGATLPKGSAVLAQRMAMLSGYRLGEAEGLASYGGLTDWCIRKLDLPSFTIECGKGTNPLPLRDAFPIYARLREVLFSIPVLL